MCSSHLGSRVIRASVSCMPSKGDFRRHCDSDGVRPRPNHPIRGIQAITALPRWQSRTSYHLERDPVAWNPCNIRSSPRKRGPRLRIAGRRLWIPAGVHPRESGGGNERKRCLESNGICSLVSVSSLVWVRRRLIVVEVNDVAEDKILGHRSEIPFSS